MTAEAQQIAIAEACGWKVAAVHVGKPIPANLLAWERGTKCVMTGNLPDYVGDLNAMHQAFKSLDWTTQCRYSAQLPVVCGSNQPNHYCNATAGQRAEAFLHAINKWALA